MSKKFTEEQYRKIVENFDEINAEYNMGLLNYNVVEKFQRKINKQFRDMFYWVEDWKEIIAIANPLTREWAHEQFVEKEKKFCWTSKKRVGEYKKRIFRLNSGMISDYAIGISPASKSYYKESLTESEIREWGYNPEMFDKTEVD